MGAPRLGTVAHFPTLPPIVVLYSATLLPVCRENPDTRCREISYVGWEVTADRQEGLRPAKLRRS